MARLRAGRKGTAGHGSRRPGNSAGLFFKYSQAEWPVRFSVVTQFTARRSASRATAAAAPAGSRQTHPLDPERGTCRAPRARGPAFGHARSPRAGLRGGPASGRTPLPIGCECPRERREFGEAGGSLVRAAGPSTGDDPDARGGERRSLPPAAAAAPRGCPAPRAPLADGAGPPPAGGVGHRAAASGTYRSGHGGARRGPQVRRLRRGGRITPGRTEGHRIFSHGTGGKTGFRRISVRPTGKIAPVFLPEPSRIPPPSTDRIPGPTGRPDGRPGGFRIRCGRPGQHAVGESAGRGRTAAIRRTRRNTDFGTLDGRPYSAFLFGHGSPGPAGHRPP
jgi:hypothetical protein